MLVRCMNILILRNPTKCVSIFIWCFLAGETGCPHISHLAIEDAVLVG